MARVAGESTLGTISLSKLSATLADFPNIKIKVGKGWVKQVEAALSVTLPLDENATEEAPSETEAA